MADRSLSYLPVWPVNLVGWCTALPLLAVPTITAELTRLTTSTSQSLAHHRSARRLS
jgi:hypothetical protein